MVIGDAQGQATILNNDTASLSVNDISLSESGTFTFTITSDKLASEAITVLVSTADGSARVLDGDYSALGGVLATIAAGSTSTTVTVAVSDDAIVENDETFTLNLSAPKFNTATDASRVVIGDAQGQATILNNDTSTLSITSPTIIEGTGAGATMLSFTVASGAAVQGGFNVAFSDLPGSASALDYAVTTLSPLSFTGTAGETRTISVSIARDAIVEANENFTLTLGAVGATTAVQVASITTGAAGTGTINNDDIAVYAISDATVAEGGNLSFTVSLSNAVDVATTINVLLTDGTTSAGDFNHTTQQVTFAAGSIAAQTVSVATTVDTTVEANETFTASLALSAPLTGGRLSNTADTGIGTINNDDIATYTISDASITEGGNLSFTVSLSNAVDVATTINVLLTDGTTSAGDFNHTTQQVTFAAGSIAAQTVSVATTVDTTVEANETFTASLALSAPLTGGRLSNTADTGIGTINNDDIATYTISDASITEGGNLSFTVSLSNAVDVATTINVLLTDGTTSAGDFNHTTQQVTFAAGSIAAQTVSVATTVDTTVEANETFTASLALSAPLTGGRLSNTADTGIGTIVDNDTVTVVNTATLQYSDKVALSATVNTGVATNVSGTVTFSIYAGGAWVLYASATVTNQATPVTVTASTAQVFLAPGSYSYRAEFVSTDAAYAGSIGTSTITVSQENADITYTGQTFVNTATATATTVVVPLEAVIRDVTAVNAASDPNAGDIRKATVTFNVFDAFSGALLTPTAINATLGLISGDTKVALAQASFTANLGSANATTYKVQTLVNGYYTGVSNDTLITVAKPADYTITGGGYVVAGTVAGTTSEGTYKADAGSKENFGINIGYNKGMTNVQGKINMIFRRTEGGVLHTYQIKSNASGALSVDAATGVATFTAKANLTDVTNDAAPISIGNYDLLLQVDDNGEPGTGSNNKGNDQFALRLMNGTTLLFASSWSGTQLLNKTLDGGNIQVRPYNETLLKVSDVTVVEGNSGTTNAVFTVSLNAVSTKAVTFTFATVFDTASAGNDYIATSGTATIAAGQSSFAITVPVIGDLAAEANEQFFLQLLTATNAGIQDAIGVGTITNDDGSPLHVLGGPATAANDAGVLTNDAVQPLVAVAIDHWRAAGADPLKLASLGVIQVQIADLPDATLGLASEGLIVLDFDAAGYGWSVSLGAPIAGRVDLLSTLTHEIGHLLGIDHDVMGESLAVGVRALPTLAQPLLTVPAVRPSPIALMTTLGSVPVESSLFADQSRDPGPLYAGRVDVGQRVDQLASAPQIDWTVRNVETRGRFDTTTSAKRWTTDFVNHLGASSDRRNPNAGLRISIPVDAPLRATHRLL